MPRTRLLEHADKPAVLHLDSEWIIRACNADGSALLHCDAARLTGFSFLDIAKNPVALRQAFDTHACNGNPATFTLDEVLTDFDGRDFWARMVFAPDGSEAAMAPGKVSITDIDALKEAFDDLRDKGDLLDQIFRVIDEAFFIDAANGTENIYMSPAYETIWGDSVDVIQQDGSSWAETIHPDDRDLVLRITAERRSRGLPLELEYRIIHRNGSLRWIWVKAFPVRDKSGKVDVYIGTISDITQRKLHEIELARLQSTQNIGAIAADLAHNFNNILSIIELSAGALVKPGSQQARETKVGTIHSAINRGREITGALLSISSRQFLHEQVFDANEAIRTLSPLISASLGSAIHAAFDLSPHPCSINADHSGFGQAIINLVANARDAMGSSGEVTVRTRVVEPGPEDYEMPGRGMMVEIRIEDTGPGMNDHVLRHALDPYFTTKEKGKGTGLGLAITNGFVIQSGGKLTVANRPAGGLAVTLTFPCAAVETTHAPASTGFAAPSATPRERVLVIDDEAALADVIGEILEQEHYAVQTATTFEAARNILHEERFDLIVSDIGLGREQSGLDLARWVRARTPDTALLIMSGYCPDSAETEGGLPFLQKPFNQDQLLHAVRSALGTRTPDASKRA